MSLTTTEMAGLVWSQCWQLTVLIVSIGLVGATCLRARPHLANVLWVLVFVKSLTLPLWSSPTGLFSWLESRRPVVAHDVWEYGQPAPSPAVTANLALPAAVTGNPVTGNPVTGHTNADRAWPASERVGKGLSLFMLAITIWAAGVIFLLSWTFCRWLEVFRLLRFDSRPADPILSDYAQSLARKLAMSSQVRVLVSGANLGPLVMGWRRPTLVLPAALTERRSARDLQPIVAHELVHARRGDTTLSALQFAAQIVWWFHPLVWWAGRESNRVCERCCDEEVIANLGCKSTAYARCLLDALEVRSQLTAVPSLPGIRSVDITFARVENVMKNNERFRSKTPAGYWALAVILALLVLPGGGLVLRATAQDFDDLKQQATQAVQSGDYQSAIPKLRAILERESNYGPGWFQLGYSLHAEGQLAEAIEVHQRAAQELTAPRGKSIALYNLACAYALTGQREAALEALQQAVARGFKSATSIAEDKDFAAIKDDPEFIRLAKLAVSFRRQFDFWVGQWDVIGRNGQQVGTNVITKDEQGFLITEKWTSQQGTTGTSINFYDPSDGKWKQTWVDAAGNVTQYSGHFRDGKMSLQGRRASPNGQVVDTRVTFSPNADGSVRQFIEHSKDQGETWTTVFDGRYVRRQSPGTTSG